MRSSSGERPLTGAPIGAWTSDRAGLLLLGAAAIGLAVAVWVRLAPLLTDFPFGDGGLFWVMANDLRAGGLVPPEVTTYNTGDIPWVYPPIGIYLVAILGGGIDLLRVLPAAWAIATLPAFWLLARALIGERGALVALLAYGLAVPAYSGLITGGGVTRGPGVLLAILAMWATVRGSALGAGVLGGLTLLTHPIAAFYAALASATLWASRGAQPRMLLAIPTALVIAGCWFGPMIARHGIDPLLAGLGSRDLDLAENVVTLMASALNPPNLAFTIGMVGVVVASRHRRWDLLAWLAVSVLGVAVVDRWMVIPFAVFAGLAVDGALERPRRPASVTLVVVALIVAVTGVVLGAPPKSLDIGERDVMAWASAETPDDATFAVVGYPVDREFVEWFPAISRRENATTWQGSEWVPGAADRRNSAEQAERCTELECLPDAGYYILRPECCEGLEALLQRVHGTVFATIRH
jgi:hypothetical protein